MVCRLLCRVICLSNCGELIIFEGGYLSTNLRQRKSENLDKQFVSMLCTSAIDYEKQVEKT